jgi:hypothetical protein
MSADELPPELVDLAQQHLAPPTAQHHHRHHDAPPHDDDHGDQAGRKVEHLRSLLMTTAQLREMPPPEPLVEGVLMRTTLVQLWGKSNSGKSFVALAWACSVATGTPWGDHAVEQVPVLYVLAEGVSGMAERVSAWERHHGVDVPDGALVWLPEPVPLTDDGWADALVTVATDVGAGLVVVDTQARATVGAEENSANEMGAVVERVERLRRTTGATVVLVHHANATGDRERGSTVVRAAIETSLHLANDQLVIDKQRNGTTDLRWQLDRHDVGDSIVMAPRLVEGAVSRPPTGAQAIRELMAERGALGPDATISTADIEKAVPYSHDQVMHAMRYLRRNELLVSPRKGHHHLVDEWSDL